MEPNKCVRCGHVWYGKNPNVKPRCCAKCKVAYWDRPARIPKPRVEPGSVGREEKYGFSTLLPGGSKLVPWPSIPMMVTKEQEKQLVTERGLIYPAAMSYARRKGWTISTCALPEGLLVRRLK